MTLTLRDAERLQGATVVDSKGEAIGEVSDVHAHEDVLAEVHVRLDGAIATLPDVGRDVLVVSPRHLADRGDGTVRMEMDLMDAVEGRAPPGGQPPGPGGGE